MSRTTAGILRINQELEKISGLDGIVADKIVALEKQVKAMVSDILDNHSEASMLDYYGDVSLSFIDLVQTVVYRNIKTKRNKQQEY